MTAQTFQAPKGTRDILAPESTRRRRAIAAFGEQAGRAGFGEIESPMFEDIGVFLRVGEATDVVTKEMFDFLDKGDPPQQLALRPELTASICRAYAEHRPTPPWKAWYAGPQFRYEKPQAGRYRQFTQVGAEVLGTDDPAVDVETIALAARFYDSLGLSRVTLLINTLGDSQSRPTYLSALADYFDGHLSELTDQSKITLAKNPLRVLDSKRGPDQKVIENAPLMTDFVDGASREHFEAVLDGLTSLGIDYEIAPRLVRGLDYYTRTTFEFAATALDASQNAVGGGGRYDGLVESLGGPATPGIGFALGIDRTLLACDAEAVFGAPASAIDVFVVDVVDGTHALRWTDRLRQMGIGADRAYDGRSMKAQMKKADKSGARLAMIIGHDEVAADQVTLRPLRGDSPQIQCATSDVADSLTQLIEASS